MMECEICKLHKQRLDHFNELLIIQCDNGNLDDSDYVRGMANGMLLADFTLRGDINIPYYGPLPKTGRDVSCNEVSSE